jgi:hypothetical protein
MNTVSLTHPALLWGLIAGLIPVLIHLLLRPKPRRLRFPALALMQPEFATGQRADQLRNILLMALRAVLLGCAALLLTGPTCTPRSADLARSGPVACVLVLDDSLSMTYRPRYADEQTLLDWARSQALVTVDNAAGWPVGSQLGLIRAGQTGGGVSLTSSFLAVADLLRDDEAHRDHAQPLGAAFREAARLLRSTRLPNRRITVLTDLSNSAWRDVDADALAGIEDLTVQIVTPLIEQPGNLGIASVALPPQVHPATAMVPVRATLLAQGSGGECWITARRDGEDLARVGPIPVAADETTEVTLRLPPRPPGSHIATLELEPADLLEFDQQWFVAWQTGPQPPVWIVAPPETEPREDLSLLLLRNLLAPEVLADEEQRVKLQVLDEDGLAVALAAVSRPDSTRDPPALIVMFPNLQLGDGVRDAVRRQMEVGTTVLLIPDSRARDPDWPGFRSMLADATPIEESVPGGTTILWEAPGDTREADDTRAEFSHCTVRRRIRLDGLVDGASVPARYSDNIPAILRLAVGRGRIVVSTTSPDPAWSELGARAAGLMAWLHGLVDEARGGPNAVAQFTAGQRSLRRFGGLPASEVVSVRLRGGRNSEPTWVRLSGGVPQQPWPTNLAGLYDVQSTGERRTAHYAVNWPAEESDLTPITEDALVEKLGTERITVVRTRELSADNGAAPLNPLRALSDPAHTLTLALLLLFVGEMVLAVRRHHASQPPPPAAG